MRGYRRSFVACFATLLVWLTALSSAPAAVSRELWRLDPGGESVPTISAPVPRGIAVVSREGTRLPALGRESSGFVPAPTQLLPPIVVVAAHAHATHGRVRRSQGLQSTYDATAPPAAR